MEGAVVAVMTCQGCGSLFESAVSSTTRGERRGNARRFCTLQCRWKAYRQKYGRKRSPGKHGSTPIRQVVFVACGQCGQHFRRRGHAPDGQAKRYNKFCSRQCAFASRARPLGRELADGCLSVLLKWVRVLAAEQRVHAGREIARQRRPPSWQCRQCQGVFKTTDRLRSICSRCRAINQKAAKKVAKAMRRARIRGVECRRVSPDAIFERDGWRCQHCQCRVSKRLDVNHPRYPNLDHVIPLSRGGSHTEENLQCLCRACNLDKSDQQLNLF